MKTHFSFELDELETDWLLSNVNDAVADAEFNASDPERTLSEQEWFKGHVEWLRTIKTKMLSGMSMSETSKLVNTPP